MDPVPNISQGVPKVEDSTESGGPFSNQRQGQIKRQHTRNQKKLAAATGPSPTIPGSGSPERCPYDCLDKV